MVTICQTCGDRGYSVALIYCRHCQVYAVHRYCLDVLPVTFEESITWFCEDCELKIVKPSSLDNLGPSKKMTKKKRRLRRLSEACKPENNATTELLEVACEECCDKDQGLGRKGLPDMVSSDERAETVKRMAISNEELEADRDKPSVEITNGNLSISQCSYYVPAQPIIEPIWRGSFNLFHKNFDTVGGLFGHLSSLACPKACEAAKLLPEVLYPVLLPKSNVWPKSFQKKGPSDESIALYFFPNNEREERVFKNLVDEMINNDLAMRAVFENVELLIFTSLVLPMKLWSFRGKCYLWGVFRGKQALQTEVRQEKHNSLVSKLDPRRRISPSSNCGAHGSDENYSSFCASVR
ncbi:uncharacterized protein LOC110815141 isoform X2 [Carica papaya]|uniref:uncharacterized protein LOC110815141 isoform X2 n=1 Tax=Carica papaya TaxID=3649 RepID=UPI000B8C9B4D|nr:uncharacterized protein LOC110815141 isoform X2 [Carica papaya]